MANEYIARRESVGLGIEATAGTPVAAQAWVRHLESSFQPKTTTIANESALGRVEKVNDSAVDTKWAEGTIEGKVADVSVGYLLSGVFGLPVTSDNADTDATVKDHTFDVEQTNEPVYLTVSVKNPVTDRRHSLGAVDTLTISGETGDWVKFSSELKAKSGTDATSTVAYIAENEFTSKNASLRLATNVAGLDAATPLEIKSFELNIERKTAPFFPMGSEDPSAMNSGVFEASGEFVMRYNATTLEDDWLDNTAQALRLSLVNDAVTIGAAANPSLTFTAPQARLTTFERSTDLDEIVEATVGFTCELSTTDAYALRAVLTNTQASYVAA